MSDQSDRLKEARVNAGYATAADAARAFGWNSNTYRAHEGGFNGLKVPVAQKYGRAFRVSANWLLTGKTDSADDPYLVGIPSSGSVPVVGDIAAGIYQEAFDMADRGEAIPFVPHPRFPKDSQAAFKVQGDSCNQFAPDGTYVNTVPLEVALPVDGLEGLLRQAEAGGRDLFVVAERSRQGLVEATLKALVRSAHGLHLEARSTNPRWRGTIPFTDAMLGEDDEIRISRVVIGFYVPALF